MLAFKSIRSTLGAIIYKLGCFSLDWRSYSRLTPTIRPSAYNLILFAQEGILRASRFKCRLGYVPRGGFAVYSLTPYKMRSDFSFNNSLTFFTPDWGMLKALKRSRCVQIFL